MKVKTQWLVKVVCIASFGLVFTADAEKTEGVEKKESKAVLDKVLVVGDPASIKKLPGSAHVVDAEEIREQNYDDINQVLRKVPGVYIRQEDGFGLFANISLRGVDTTRSAKVTLMEDGIPTAPAPYSAPAAYYTPTVGRMERVEILKGSSQVRYGPQTTGGVVNYISTPVPLAKRAYARSSFGSFGDVRVHSYLGNTLTTKNGRFGYLLEGYYRKNDGFKRIDETPDFRQGDNTGFSKTDPMVKFYWEPDTAIYQHIELKYGSSDLDANLSYLGLSEADVAQDPFRRYAASRFDNIKSLQRRSYLRYAVGPTSDLDIIATVYRNTFKRNWYKLKDLRDIDGDSLSLSAALAGALDGAGLDCLRGEAACTLRVRANNRTYQSEGVDVVGYYRIDSANLAHEFSAGVRFNQDQVRRFQWDDNYNQLANGAIADMTPGEPGDAGNRLQTTDAIAIFFQDTIESGKWGFTPGVRFEQLEQTYRDFSNPSKSGNNTMGLWAASLGITYAINKDWTIFGSVNRGFSPPSPKSAVKDIEEETSLAYEAGLRYSSLETALEIELVTFLTDFDNLIVIDNIGGTGTGETENFGQVRSQGVEFVAKYDAGMAAGWSFRNPWFVTATYTSAKQRNAAASTDPESIFSYGQVGNRVPYIPEWVLTAGTSIEAGSWGGSISANYVSETFTSASNTPLQQNGAGEPDVRFGKTDDYFVVDVSGFYRFKDGVKLFAGVQNVTDEVYIVSRQPEGPRTGMPLFAYVGLELDL